MADKSEGSNVQTESTPESKSEKTPVYKVLTNATFPPFDTIDENTGEIIGFDMDLIAAIGEDQGCLLYTSAPEWWNFFPGFGECPAPCRADASSVVLLCCRRDSV